MKLIKKLKSNENMISFLFYCPALAFAILFFIYPVLSSFYYSLTDWDGVQNTSQFIGFDNFRKLTGDGKFFTAMRNTFIYSVCVVSIQNVAALILAVALDSSVRTRNALRTAFFTPAVMSALVVGYTWTFIYNPLFGVLNTLLTNIGLEFLALDWLGDPKLALGSVITITIWQFTGYSMVIFLTGLQGIPTELFEASSIDGTNGWQKFYHITFPLIAPAVTINVLLSMIGTMKAFDLIYVTTQGGPGYATETIATVLYSEAFQTNRMGYGTAIAVVLFLIILVLSLIQLTILRRREVTM